jgi:hypothetical protein
VTEGFNGIILEILGMSHKLKANEMSFRDRNEEQVHVIAPDERP